MGTVHKITVMEQILGNLYSLGFIQVLYSLLTDFLRSRRAIDPMTVLSAFVGLISVAKSIIDIINDSRERKNMMDLVESHQEQGSTNNHRPPRV